MKNKRLSIVLTIILSLVFAFSLSACGHQHTFSLDWETSATHHWHKATCEHVDEKSNFGEHVYTDDQDQTCDVCQYEREISSSVTTQTLSTIYKEIAVELWASIGVEDPTNNSGLSLLSNDFPELTTETTDQGEIENIMINANTSAGLFYMISLLYQNDTFVLTDGVAHYDAVCHIPDSILGTIEMSYTFKLKPELDFDNNKAYLEVTSLVSGMTQYSYMELDYNFEAKNLISYKFYTMIVELEKFVGMSLSEDGKYLFYDSGDLTDPFSMAINNRKEQFVSATENLQKLTGNFNSEMQAYFDALSEYIVQ